MDASRNTTARLKALQARSTQFDGVVKVYAEDHERSIEREEARKIVAQWQPKRIAGLVEYCHLPVKRAVSILGITQPAYSMMCAGKFTPSAALCLRMKWMEEMSDSGELHARSELIPTQREMRRRMSAFRAWWFNRPPSAEFPLLRIELTAVWGKSPHQRLRLPVESFPKVRLQKWNGLVGFVREITTLVRKLARANGRLYWTQVEEDFWRAYASDTIPRIVLERAAIPERASKTAKARRKEGRKEAGTKVETKTETETETKNGIHS